MCCFSGCGLRDFGRSFCTLSNNSRLTICENPCSNLYHLPLPTLKNFPVFEFLFRTLFVLQDIFIDNAVHQQFLFVRIFRSFRYFTISILSLFKKNPEHFTDYFRLFFTNRNYLFVNKDVPKQKTSEKFTS